MDGVYVGMKIRLNDQDLTVLEILEYTTKEWKPINSATQTIHDWTVLTEDGIKKL